MLQVLDAPPCEAPAHAERDHAARRRDVAREVGAGLDTADHVRGAKRTSRSLEQQVPHRELADATPEALDAARGERVGAATGLASPGAGNVAEPAGVLTIQGGLRPMNGVTQAIEAAAEAGLRAQPDSAVRPASLAKPRGRHEPASSPEEAEERGGTENGEHHPEDRLAEWFRGVSFMAAGLPGCPP